MIDDISDGGLQEGKVLQAFESIRVYVLESIRMTLCDGGSILMKLTKNWRKRSLQAVMIMIVIWFCRRGSAAFAVVHLLAVLVAAAAYLLALHA